MGIPPLLVNQHVSQPPPGQRLEIDELQRILLKRVPSRKRGKKISNKDVIGVFGRNLTFTTSDAKFAVGIGWALSTYYVTVTKWGGAQPVVTNSKLGVTKVGGAPNPR